MTAASRDSRPDAAPKQYQRPSLTDYGSIHSMILGGSGSGIDGIMTMMR